MKKILILSALFSAMLGVQAENVVGIVPFTTEAGVVSDDAQTFELSLTNETCKAGIVMFKLYLPKGLNLDLTYDVDGEENTAAEMIETRLKYKSGRNEVSTGHKAKYNYLGEEDGFNVYQVLINSDGDKPIQGTSGSITKFYYVTDSSLEAGVYPIYVREIELTDVEALTMVSVDAATSYVQVGTPSSSSLAFEGVVPSFVSGPLASVTGVSRFELSKVTEWNGDFTYVDGREVVAPATEVVADLKYTHADGKYYSVKAPFAYETSAKVYTFNGVSGEYANFTEATSVPANTPVLVEGALELNAKAAIGGVKPEAKSNVYYVQGETLYHGNNITVKPMRGVWEGAAASNLRIAIDGVVTGIDAAQIDAQSNSFDLQGRQVQNTKNGVFVVNGKKQFVK